MPNRSVAIDGPVASGKSTAARAVAERLDLAYIDTGAMYRAATLAALQAGVDPFNEAGVVALLAAAPIAVHPDARAPLGYRIYRDGAELGSLLFGEDVASAVSVVAAHPRVRTAMVEEQQRLAARSPVVMAGRDIGTVVLPDARFKVFLTASLEARVARRCAELWDRGVNCDQTQLRRQIQERDRLDSTRLVAPLRPALGAVVIDSSELNADEVVERIVALIRS